MTILFDKNKNALISENRAFFVRNPSETHIHPTNQPFNFIPYHILYFVFSQHLLILIKKLPHENRNRIFERAATQQQPRLVRSESYALSRSG